MQKHIAHAILSILHRTIIPSPSLGHYLHSRRLRDSDSKPPIIESSVYIATYSERRKTSKSLLDNPNPPGLADVTPSHTTRPAADSTTFQAIGLEFIPLRNSHLQNFLQSGDPSDISDCLPTPPKDIFLHDSTRHFQ